MENRGERQLGRFLDKNEVVHHIDGNPLNNSLDNLYLFPSDREHQKYHNQLRKFIRGFINASG